MNPNASTKDNRPSINPLIATGTPATWAAEKDTSMEVQSPEKDPSNDEPPAQNPSTSSNSNPVPTTEVLNHTPTSGSEVANVATPKGNPSAPTIPGEIQVPTAHGKATHSISNASQGSEKAPLATVPIDHIYSMLGVSSIAAAESAIRQLKAAQSPKKSTSSWGSPEVLPSPGTMLQTVTASGQACTLEDICMDEYHTKGITPKWNDDCEKFFEFQQQIILRRNEAIWASITFLKKDGKTIDIIISNPYEVDKQSLFTQSPHMWGLIWTKLSIAQDYACLFSQFLQNSLETPFKVAQMSNIPIHFHMDGCYIWTSILQDVFVSCEMYGTAWCKVIEHAHPSKYNYDFDRYHKDIQKHLQLMKAASFPMNGINSYIMHQLCSWNIGTFTRQMENITLPALTDNWSCDKILNQANFIKQKLVATNLWKQQDTAQDFQALLASKHGSKLICSLMNNFAVKTSPSPQKDHNPITNNQKFPPWQLITQPSNLNTPIPQARKDYWFCTSAILLVLYITKTWNTKLGSNEPQRGCHQWLETIAWT